MKVGAAALSGAVLGVLGTLCFFLAFATDYWLVARDSCGRTERWNVTQDENGTTVTVVEQVAPSALVLHHQGFFWHCVFDVDPGAEPHLSTLYTNQPASKYCLHGYLFPLPVALGPVPHPMYDTTAVFRGFWTVLIVLALLCALVGGFLLVCGVPFYSHKLYRVGGALLIAAACLFLSVLLLYVMWVELVDVRSYILQESGPSCPTALVQIHYGLSFMVAGAGVPLVLISGITFMCIARALGGDKC
ncbi:transmembrane protein 182-like [Eucyclogobius newberryi]|uniref:transmembrane protein 182-like n=1 Tax=Eucyclogobius newberryi TaxID=166745 RepID=UPI003B5C6CAF